jgi:predicted kinase
MPEMPRPTLVVVSGPPSSGKTTLAHAIGRAIPCPVICRDEIKEGMVHAEGREFEAAAGDPLTVRTFSVFFDLVRVLLLARATVVAEAAFQDQLWRQGLEPLAELARIRIVQCKVDAGVAYERYVRRNAVDAHTRKAHAVIIGTELADWERAYSSFHRISLTVPSIDVDTADGYTPDVAEIVDLIDRS